ncbi:helix-turn-helix transcriptional regulator [Naumannella halotolerans]|uniref:Putative ArsR family transcriptional regulator n=1 Tax=Naumannella halotolerans TaxID=993414 RepID=A0A4R7J8P8_9ACTN|nr:HTH domain-containing protein [Naumannella halotolerans]TDT32863.1 putative ArsR family transcriptional regulator [Naumannella halotolerans]
MPTLQHLDPAAQPVAGTDGETDASTRHRVARSILEHGPSTAGELAERLNVTPAAIRRHLSALIASGELSSAERRVRGQRGRGRPAKVFSLTDTGRSGFSQAYDELAVGALRALEATGGPAAVKAFARERIREVEQRFAEQLDRRTDRSPGEILAEVLTDHGYVASVEPAHGGEQLCQHHCPIASVAEKFPELCEAETQAFADLLGVHVQRLATIADGDGVCTTNIPDLPRTIPTRKAAR